MAKSIFVKYITCSVAYESSSHRQAARWDVTYGSFDVIGNPFHKISGIIKCHKLYFIFHLLLRYIAEKFHWSSCSAMRTHMAIICSVHVTIFDFILILFSPVSTYIDKISDGKMQPLKVNVNFMVWYSKSLILCKA